jgi:hypothetical protein
MDGTELAGGHERIRSVLMLKRITDWFYSGDELILLNRMESDYGYAAKTVV